MRETLHRLTKYVLVHRLYSFAPNLSPHMRTTTSTPVQPVLLHKCPDIKACTLVFCNHRDGYTRLLGEEKNGIAVVCSTTLWVRRYVGGVSVQVWHRGRRKARKRYVWSGCISVEILQCNGESICSLKPVQVCLECLVDLVRKICITGISAVRFELQHTDRDRSSEACTAVPLDERQ